MTLKEEYYIQEINYKTAMQIVVEHHYLHRKCPVSIAFGLFEVLTSELVGVITYGIPASNPVRVGLFGEEEKQQVVELNRLWVDESVPKNGESFLIGNTLKLVPFEIIVSYADTKQNHLGIVYQATN